MTASMWANNKVFFFFICLLGVLMGCNEPMEPASTISKLRVMAVQADPPEIRPGEGTTLRVLYADPKGEGREITFLWLTSLGELTPSSDLSPDNIEMIGFHIGTPKDGGDVYPVPPVPNNVLENLPEDQDYLTATTLLSVCAGGELPELSEVSEMTGLENIDDLCKGGDNLVVFKTFRISDATPQNRNTNPALTKVTFDGRVLEEIPAGETIHSGSAAIFTCESTANCLNGADIEAGMTEESFETFERIEFDEVTIHDEAPYISWFVTDGELDENRSRTNTPPGPFENTWVPPLNGGIFSLWVVAHDTRGGTSWKQFAIGAKTTLDH